MVSDSLTWPKFAMVYPHAYPLKNQRNSGGSILVWHLMEDLTGTRDQIARWRYVPILNQYGDTFMMLMCRGHGILNHQCDNSQVCY